jgi:hypothetical protein
MAWDALSNIFKNKQDEDGTKSLRTSYAPGTGQASAGSVATNPGDYSSFQGTGGSQGGGPVSARFVNFGTMYDLNKDKAAKQADAVQSKAAGAAADAQASLQGAHGKFNQQAGWGTGRGTAGGQHPTKIGTYAETGPGSSWTAGTAQPIGKTNTASPTTWTNTNTGNQTDRTAQGSDPEKGGLGRSINPSGGISITDSSLDQGIKADEQSSASAAAQAAADAAKNRNGNWRYQQLFGNGTQLLGGVGDPRQNENVVSELDAKSGAGQQYTGPDSLQGMLGDEAYGALGEDLRKAEAGTQALTNEGGIAQALGYGPGMSQGNSALDTGLTETAGRQQFKALADKYKGLSSLLPAAQSDSLRAAEGARIQSDAAAKQWQDLLDEHEAAAKAATDAETQQKQGEHRKSLHDDSFYDPSTNAGALTKETGYTAQEVEDAWPELSEEERAYLGRGHNFFENLTGYGFTGDEASIRENIIAKLAKRRAANGSK